MASVISSRIARANNEPGKDEFVPAIVIGSGFGGAVAALRLGQAGINTVLLERGRRWLITPEQNTFATYRQPDGRAAWLSSTTYDGVPVDVYTGILERKDENGISVLCGAGVGGGSLVYNCVHYQPSRELFYRVFPPEIDYDELDSVYYPRARSVQKVSVIPQDILASNYYLLMRRFLEQANVAGIPNRLLDLAIDWDIVREEINGTKVPSAIAAEVWYGHNSGAKNSLDRNYLVEAEQTGKVSILPLHLVTTISEVAGHGYRVSCNEINESGEVVTTKSFTCRYLFLAAGSMGTSALLVKAKATGTLPRLNDYIGLEWGNNGDTFCVRSGVPGPTNSQQGGPASALIQHFDNPIGPISLMCFPVWNAPEGTIASLGMGIPSVKGKFSYDATTGLVKLNWPENGSQSGDPKVLEAAKFTYKLLNRKNATSKGKNRTTIDLSGSTTAHPLGGAVMGKACDFYGRVKGYKRLYVVDGALIPGSAACTNPAFTIAALAERNLERILAEDIVG
jgi:cholesterol oxidase